MTSVPPEPPRGSEYPDDSQDPYARRQGQDPYLQDQQGRQTRGREMQDREMQERDMQSRQMQDRDMQNRDRREREMRDRDVQNRDMQNRDMQNREMQGRDRNRDRGTGRDRDAQQYSAQTNDPARTERGRDRTVREHDGRERHRSLLHPLDLALIGLPILGLIFSFLHWYTLRARIDSGTFAGTHHLGRNAWHGFFGWFGVILALAAAALMIMHFLTKGKMNLRAPVLGLLALALISHIISAFVTPGKVSAARYAAQLSSGHAGAVLPHQVHLNYGLGPGWWLTGITHLLGLGLAAFLFKKFMGMMKARKQEHRGDAQYAGTQTSGGRKNRF